MPLWRIMPRQALYERALNIYGRYGFSFYDALIVATALEGAAPGSIAKTDRQDGQRIERIVIEHRFRER